MGSKISKAVRRPHGQAAATVMTADKSTTHQQDEHKAEPCQDLSLPNIVSGEPMDVDVTVATSSHTTDVTTTPNDTMNPQPDEAQPAAPFEVHEDTNSERTSTALPNEAMVDPLPFAPQDNEENDENTNYVTSVPPPPPQLDYTPQPPPPPPDPEITCAVCCEYFTKEQEHSAFLFPCNLCDTAYCTKCIMDMFVKACKDFSRMPPRCCTQIQLHVARPYLTIEQAAEFREKYEEWSTPNPVYCPVPTCSAFISTRILQRAEKTNKGKQRVDSVIGTPTSPVIACPKCNADICTNCREVAHNGTMCNKLAFGVDDDTAALLVSWGYKRCPKCGNGVRRMYGCNHMQCLCGSHWCWVCQKSRDDCDGGCYESDDDDYSVTDSEDGSNDGNSETSQTENTENAEGDAKTEEPNAMAREPSTAGEASTESAEPPRSPPQPIRRPQNLDRRSRHHWEDSGFDFGDEPTDDIQDRAWDCIHTFETAKVSYAESLRRTSPIGMECTKCWCIVHPEVEQPVKANAINRMVIGGGRGRGRGRGGVARLRVRRRRLDDPELGHNIQRLSESLPQEADWMEGIQFDHQSANGDRVVDTYGNVISTTDFILNPEPPRRASFDFSFTAQPMMTFEPRRYDSMPWRHRFPASFDGADEEGQTFSLAYECTGCGVLLCEACKEDAMVEAKAREEAKEQDEDW